jgi:DNA (cytosine-5)-methyltransferase 1
VKPRKAAAAVAIDLFAGAGGLSLGLSRSGFTIGAALDNDPIASETYRRNIGDHITCASIEEVSAADLMKRAGVGRGECTLLTGGPPCQGFSLQRRGSRTDVRNELVLQFVRMVEDVRPHFFLMENVGGLLTKHGKIFLDEFAQRAARLGYVIHIELLDAAEFGVPQHRRRAFLVGERCGSRAPVFQFPKARGGVKHRTVRDAIGDLPSPPLDGSCHPNYDNHYRERRLAAINVERIRHVPQGGGREHLPPHLQLDCHKNNLDHRHLDVYGRLAWKQPSVTLTARFDSFTRGRFAHPIEHRSITIREGARIQTFPDSFAFGGNREDQARQVGNAVPPLLAEQLGAALLSAISMPGILAA